MNDAFRTIAQWNTDLDLNVPAAKLPNLVALFEHMVTEADDRHRYVNDWSRPDDGTPLLFREALVRQVVHVIKAGPIRYERQYFDANPDRLNPVEYERVTCERLKVAMRRLANKL